jgi:hypothetical protein
MPEQKGKGPSFRASVSGYDVGAAWERTSQKSNPTYPCRSISRAARRFTSQSSPPTRPASLKRPGTSRSHAPKTKELHIVWRED